MPHAKRDFDSNKTSTPPEVNWEADIAAKFEDVLALRHALERYVRHVKYLCFVAKILPEFIAGNYRDELYANKFVTFKLPLNHPDAAVTIEFKSAPERDLRELIEHCTKYYPIFKHAPTSRVVLDWSDTEHALRSISNKLELSYALSFTDSLTHNGGPSAFNDTLRAEFLLILKDVISKKGNQLNIDPAEIQNLIQNAPAIGAKLAEPYIFDCYNRLNAHISILHRLGQEAEAWTELASVEEKHARMGFSLPRRTP